LLKLATIPVRLGEAAEQRPVVVRGNGPLRQEGELTQPEQNRQAPAACRLGNWMKNLGRPQPWMLSSLASPVAASVFASSCL